MAIKQIIKSAALAAAAAVAVTACGSEQPDVTAQADAAVPAVEEPQTGPEAEVPDAEVPNDLALVDEQAAGEAAFSGEDGEAWCVEIENVAISQGGNPLSMEVFGLSPTEMEAQYTTNNEVFNRMKAVASPEIEEAVSDVAAVFETFLTMGAAAGWDLDTMIADPEFMAAFDLVSLQTAVSEIERYTLEVCGLDLSS